MPDNDTVFDKSSETAKDGGTAGTDTLDTGASELVGEGKKYATVEEALKSIPHAQSHISTLESELSELRTKAAKGATMDEILAQLKERTTQGTESPAPTGVDNLDERVEQVVSKMEAKGIAERNLQTVDTEIKALYGDKSREVYEGKIRSLGMSPEQGRDLAAASPKAFMEIFGKQASSGEPSGVTTGGHTTPRDTGSTKPNAYTELLREDKAKFLSKDMQLEMYKKAMENPEEFFKSAA